MGACIEENSRMELLREKIMNGLFDRTEMIYPPLAERYSKVDITEASVKPETVSLDGFDGKLVSRCERIAEEIRSAKELGASVVCAFGAHSIKNGLGRLIGTLLREGYFTHVCTNGAGIIHDWEFAFLGRSSEDVRANVAVGRFGTWQETGEYINLAITAGAYAGLGYAESVGKLVNDDGIMIPSAEELESAAADRTLPARKRAAALDFKNTVELCGLKEGFLEIPHSYKKYSIHPYVSKSDGRFTCHPMFGHDIIYTHYANNGAAIGRCAETDFLSYADSISKLQNGVYLSIGSAVMSPMIFEKSLSMSRNVSLQSGRNIDSFSVHVADLQKSAWDWSKGEPPMDDPAYYLRYMKTFSRMGGNVDYISADNRDILQILYTLLHI